MPRRQGKIQTLKKRLTTPTGPHGRRCKLTQYGTDINGLPLIAADVLMQTFHPLMVAAVGETGKFCGIQPTSVTNPSRDGWNRAACLSV